MIQYIPGLKTVLNAKKEESFNFEFALDEYLPSVAEIIKTSVKTEKCTLNRNGTVLSADLYVKICIIYLSDFNGKIKNAVLKKDIHIDTRLNEDIEDDCICTFSHSIFSPMAKQVTTRKLSVSFLINGNFTVYQKTSTPVFCPDENSGICTLDRTLSVCEKSIYPEEQFDFSCDLTLDAGMPPASDVIFCDGVFSQVSCKHTEQGLEVNATLTINALYEAANQDSTTSSEYTTVSAAFPFTKTLESPLFEDDPQTSLYLDVNCVEPSVSFDPYGENRVIAFNTKYSIGANIYKTNECCAVTDAFIEKCSCCTDTKVVNYESFLKPVYSKTTQSAEINGDFSYIQNISDTFCKIHSVNFEQNEGKLFAAVKCNLDILAQGNDNKLIFPSHTCVLHVPVPETEFSDFEIIPEIFVSVPSCRTYLKDGKLYGDFDIVLDGAILRKNSVKVVEKVEKTEQENTPGNQSRIVIYYPPKDETVWDIAKKYSTNPAKLKKSNNLEGEEITDKKFIIIP